MSAIHHRPEPSFDLTPKLALGRSTVRESFAVQKNPWWKEEPTADGKGLPFGRTQIQRRDGEPVFDREPVKQLFGLRAEPTLFLGKQKNVHRLR